MSHRQSLTPTVQRVVDAAAEFMDEPDGDELAFLHTVLTRTFLPYRDPKSSIRESGCAGLFLTAGCQPRPENRGQSGISLGNRG